MLSAVLIAACSSAAFAASKPAAPKVQKLTSTNAGEIVITTDWQKAVKGYQIKYSLKSNFANAKTKNIEPGSRGSDGRMRFDCSGFTSYILNNVMKQYIPNYDISNGISAQETIEYLYSDKNGAFNADIVCSGKPDFTKLQPGDLVFFNDRTQNYTGACDHVGIYIGNKEFIHSVGTVDGVVIMPLGSGRYYERFLFAKSFVPNEDPVPIDEAVSVVSQYTTGSNVYSDIKFKEPNGDKVYTGDIVILKYITPCSWTDENCCYIEYDAGSTGYIQQNRLKM